LSAHYPLLSEWDIRFIEQAEHIKTWSKDPRRKVGCVLVRDKRILSTGYNGFPKGVSDLEARLNNKALKNLIIVHAEVNAVIQAALHGTSTEGATAYSTYHPCTQCASTLINAGVTKIVSPSPEFCADSRRDNFKTSSDILLEAGVSVLYYPPNYELL
jgi:dCMP deaminase